MSKDQQSFLLKRLNKGLRISASIQRLKNLNTIHKILKKVIWQDYKSNGADRGGKCLQKRGPV